MCITERPSLRLTPRTWNDLPIRFGCSFGPPSKLGSQRDGRPAQVVDVTLRPRFVFELCAPRRCHASDHGASGIRLPGLGRGFDDGDALALEDGCFLLGIQLRPIPNELLRWDY